VADLAFLEGGVQVQADYCNSTCCHITSGKGSGSTFALVMQDIAEVLYVYAEAVNQMIIHMKPGKFSELRMSEITSAGFSGIIPPPLHNMHHISVLGT